MKSSSSFVAVAAALALSATLVGCSSGDNKLTFPKADGNGSEWSVSDCPSAATVSDAIGAKFKVEQADSIDTGCNYSADGGKQHVSIYVGSLDGPVDYKKFADSSIERVDAYGDGAAFRFWAATQGNGGEASCLLWVPVIGPDFLTVRSDTKNSYHATELCAGVDSLLTASATQGD